MRIRQAVVAWGLLLACAGSVGQAQAVRLADGTAVRVRLTADLLSAQVLTGTRVDLEIAQPVMLQGVVVIPLGSVAWGAVQDVKKGKSLHFDIEGVRLPNKDVVKLRCSPQKTKVVTKDEIKIEAKVGADVGARKGSEFTAYLDQDLNVDLGAAAMTPAPPAPKPETPTVPAPPVVSPPVTTPAPTVTNPAPVVQSGERITVECFSEPGGADILIDDEYHGSTPAILKILPGNHQIEFRLMGYSPHSQPLNLTPGTGLRTVRMTLVKLP